MFLAEVKMFKFAGGETQVTFKNPSTSYTDNNVQITATTLPNIVVSKPSYTLVAPYSGAKRVTLYVTHGIF